MIVLESAAAEYARLVAQGTDRLAEAGRLLIEIKAQLKHGEWMPWLKANGIKQSTANTHMKIAGMSPVERQRHNAAKNGKFTHDGRISETAEETYTCQPIAMEALDVPDRVKSVISQLEAVKARAERQLICIWIEQNWG